MVEHNMCLSPLRPYIHDKSIGFGEGRGVGGDKILKFIKLTGNVSNFINKKSGLHYRTVYAFITL